MKWALVPLLLLCISSSAQVKQSNNSRLDSLKKIARQNPELFSEKKQIKWANALIELGKYYEKNHEIKKSIYCFERLLDSELDNLYNFYPTRKLIAECDAIRKRLSDYYFIGNGIKIDIEKSYWYAFNVFDGNKGDYVKFSKRYFNTTAVIIAKTDTIDYKNDSIFICTLNSFLQKSNGGIKEIDATALNDIANRFKQHNADAVNFIHLTYYPPVCCKNDMCRVQSSLEKIKNYLTERHKIAKNKIITHMELGGGESYSSFNNLRTPVIEIKFSKTGSD